MSHTPGPYDPQPVDPLAVVPHDQIDHYDATGTIRVPWQQAVDRLVRGDGSSSWFRVVETATNGTGRVTLWGEDRSGIQLGREVGEDGWVDVLVEDDVR